MFYFHFSKGLKLDAWQARRFVFLLLFLFSPTPDTKVSSRLSSVACFLLCRLMGAFGISLPCFVFLVFPFSGFAYDAEASAYLYADMLVRIYSSRWGKVGLCLLWFTYSRWKLNQKGEWFQDGMETDEGGCLSVCYDAARYILWKPTRICRKFRNVVVPSSLRFLLRT